MREIILDTETTGLDKNQDRVIEIGCVEIIDKNLTGRNFHVYINPEGRIIPAEVVAIHGLTNERLKNEPVFSEIAQDFLDFIQDSQLVAHNAFFDINFLNAELERAGHKIITVDRVFDTLALAKRTFPGQQNNLDALCRRYGINNSHRTLHGALLDAEILYDVYLKLTGANQAGFSFEKEAFAKQNVLHNSNDAKNIKKREKPLPSRLEAHALKLHKDFIEEKIGQQALWYKYL